MAGLQWGHARWKVRGNPLQTEEEAGNADPKSAYAIFRWRLHLGGRRFVPIMLAGQLHVIISTREHDIPPLKSLR